MTVFCKCDFKMHSSRVLGFAALDFLLCLSVILFRALVLKLLIQFFKQKC